MTKESIKVDASSMRYALDELMKKTSTLHVDFSLSNREHFAVLANYVMIITKHISRASGSEHKAVLELYQEILDEMKLEEFKDAALGKLDDNQR